MSRAALLFIPHKTNMKKLITLDLFPPHKSLDKRCLNYLPPHFELISIQFMDHDNQSIYVRGSNKPFYKFFNEIIRQVEHNSTGYFYIEIRSSESKVNIGFENSDDAVYFKLKYQ